MGVERTALIVDDNALGRELARDILEGAGYQVAEAATVAEALNLLGKSRFDVCLLDWHLRGMTGKDLLRALPVTCPVGAPRTLVVTADARGETAQDALGSGADGVVTKPYRPAELLIAVDRVLTL